MGSPGTPGIGERAGGEGPAGDRPGGGHLPAGGAALPRPRDHRPGLLTMLAGASGMGKTELRLGMWRAQFDGEAFSGLPTARGARSSG